MTGTSILGVILTIVVILVLLRILGIV